MIRTIIAFISLFVSLVCYSAETIRVGVVNPGYQDTGFWGQVSNVMAAAAKQLNIELVEVYGQRHWKIMLNEGRVLIEQQPLDYLILVNEHQRAKDLIRLAEHKQLPTFMLLNDFDEPEQTYSFWKGGLIPDNHAAGLEMANRLFALQQGSPRLFTMIGDHLTPASLARTSGLDSALQANPSVKELLRVSGEWSEEVAYQKTLLMLRRDTPNMIWAANDNIALGAIRALKQHNLVPGKDVALAGLNWSQAGLNAVEQGELLLTHGGHFMAGGWMLVMIHDYHQANGAIPTLQQTFEMSAIDATNIKKYLECFGDKQWSRIDFRRYALSKEDLSKGRQYPFHLKSMFRFASGCRQ